MLRIDTIEDAEGAVLRLEGRLIGPWVEEVRRSCRAALSQGGAVTIDLASVSFVDADGIVLLRELASPAVGLANATPFVTAQLRG